MKVLNNNIFPAKPNKYCSSKTIQRPSFKNIVRVYSFNEIILITIENEVPN